MEHQKYIIRGDRSGVFYGEIAERNDRDVKITNCRRLWYWDGAASLSQLALEGVKAPDSCKFTVTVPQMQVMEVIEIIPCTEKAIDNIENVTVWKN